MKLNIAVINIQSAVSATRGWVDFLLKMWKYWLPHSHEPLRKCAETLKKEDIDLAFFTEISEKSVRTGFRSQTVEMKELSGMEHARFFSSQEKGKFFFHEGNAMLSRFPLSDFDSHILPIEMMRIGLEEATMTVGDKKVTVFLAHLALGRKKRLEQLEVIKKIVNSRAGPMILTGDFNETDPSYIEKFRSETRFKTMCNLKNYPSWNPYKPLIYALSTEDFIVHDFYLQKQPSFSDHLALIIKAELR